jgi:epoxyqueuosine reductase
LIASLDDVEPLVRSHAAWALGEIGSKLAVEGLLNRLQTETDEAVRAEIDTAMTQLGEADRVAQRE